MLFQSRFLPVPAGALRAGILAVIFLIGSTAPAATSVPTAVHAKTLNGYKRAKLKDGSYRPEYYVMTDGGILAEATRDNSQHKVPFMAIVRVLEKTLAQQNYLMADDAASAELLLVVHWGRTVTFNDVGYAGQMSSAGQARAAMVELRAEQARDNSSQNAAAAAAAAAEFEQQMIFLQLQNLQRDRENEKNALLLGYKQDMDGSNDIRRTTMQMNLFDELRGEIEQARYFVVITAYRLPLPKDPKKQKLLWSTRVSIKAAGNDFEQRLDQMVASATRYAGRDSRRLIRQFQGTVELGELTVVGVEDSPEDPAPPVNPDQGK